MKLDRDSFTIKENFLIITSNISLLCLFVCIKNVQIEYIRIYGEMSFTEILFKRKGEGYKTMDERYKVEM